MSSTSVNDRFEMDPDSDLDYLEDWSAWLGEGDTIASAEWIVPDGLTSHDTSHTSTTTTIWLTGGTLNQTYQVTTRITTVQGRTEDKTQTFDIRQN
jgi:hypothetical protein